jgi:hypothetical protein
MLRPSMARPRSIELTLSLFALLACACGGSGKKKDTGVQFIAEDRFVVDPSLIREAQSPRWHLPWQDVKLAVRTAAALENNCPLELTEVLVEMKTWQSPRIAVRVCGVERVYQQFDDLGYIDVSPDRAPPVLPIGAPASSGEPASTEPSPTDPSPAGPLPTTTPSSSPPSNPPPVETTP